jgi:YaiO family outer membrane protein
LKNTSYKFFITLLLITVCLGDIAPVFSSPISQSPRYKSSTDSQETAKLELNDLREQKSRVHRLLRGKKFGEAEEVAKNLLARDDQNQEVKHLYANVLRINKKLDQAVQVYSELIVKSPKDLDFRLGRARSLLAQKEYEKSRNDFLFVLNLQEKNFAAKRGLLILSNTIQHEKKLQADREQAMNRRETLTIARNYIKGGRFELAVDLYRDLLKSDRRNIEIKTYLAGALRMMGNYQEAEELYIQLRKENPENVDILVGQGFLHLNRGDKEKATVNFRTALKLDNDNSDALKGLEIIASADKARLLKERVNRLQAEKNYSDAGSVLESAMAENPADSDVQYMLARNYYYQGDHQKSLDLLNELMKRDADNPDYLIIRSGVLRALKKYEESGEDYQKILDSDPNNRDALWGKGVLSYKEKDYFASKDYLGRLLEQDAGHRNALNLMASVDNFASDRLTLDSYIETFSDREFKQLYGLEWFHPFSNRFRGLVGTDVLISDDDTDPSGFIGFNYDLFINTNLAGKVAYAPKADFLPEWIFETELTQRVADYPLSLHLLYRFMDFKTVDFNLISPGLTYYVTDRFFVLLRGYFGFQANGESQSALLKLNYQVTPKFLTYIGGVIGNESTRITTVDETRSVDSKTLLAGFRMRVSRSFSIEFNYEYEDREDQYIRHVFGFVIPLYF